MIVNVAGTAMRSTIGVSGVTRANGSGVWSRTVPDLTSERTRVTTFGLLLNPARSSRRSATKTVDDPFTSGIVTLRGQTAYSAIASEASSASATGTHHGISGFWRKVSGSGGGGGSSPLTATATWNWWCTGWPMSSALGAHGQRQRDGVARRHRGQPARRASKRSSSPPDGTRPARSRRCRRCARRRRSAPTCVPCRSVGRAVAVTARNGRTTSVACRHVQRAIAAPASAR